MPELAVYLPNLIPIDSLIPLRTLGERVVEYTGFSIKGQDYIHALLETVTAYALGEFQRVARENPDRARRMAENMLVPDVSHIEGRKEWVVRKIPLRTVIESLAAKEAEGIAKSFVQKYSNRVVVS